MAAVPTSMWFKIKPKLAAGKREYRRKRAGLENHFPTLASPTQISITIYRKK